MQTIDRTLHTDAAVTLNDGQRQGESTPSGRSVSWLTNAGLALALLAILLVSRLHELDALVTPDEPLWVARSANFYEALSSGEFEDTYQAAHPGVTTMWLGALAYRLADPKLQERMGGQIEMSEVRGPVVPAGELPINTLVELRRILGIANSIVMVALFLCLIPLTGRWAALVATAFLGLDPLHIGLTRLLHLDGLSTNLLLLGVVAYCWRLLKGSRTGLVVSGIATGLALLTRSVNGVQLPLLALLTILDAIGMRPPGQSIAGQVRQHAITLVVWLGIALVTVFALWPALWVSPIDTIEQVVLGGSDLASAPHQRQVLFRGVVTTADPGWLYYPIVLLYRIGPIALLGLVLAGAFLMRPAPVNLFNRRLICSLIGFAVAYIGILTLAAKKLDRYLLPSLAALDLVAALGAFAAIRLLIRQMGVTTRLAATSVAVAGGALLLVGQAIAAMRSEPYYLTYVSPLVGGEDAARGKISLGWGEGGKAVAEAIQALPQIGPAEIAGGLWPDAIDYYLPYEIGQANYELGSSGAAWFLDSHYLIVTEPEIQRQFYSPGMIAWFDTQEPVATVRDDGRVYARIFDFSDTPLPQPYYLGEAPIYTWGGARLVASTFRSEIESGMDLRVRLFFETTGAPFYYWITAKVTDEQGDVVGQIRKRMRTADLVGPEARSIFDIDLPADLPLGTYTVRISLRDDETGEVLTSVHAVTCSETERSVSLGTFSVVQDINVTEP